jgi:ATP-dependent helicase/nuclease subunit A
MSLLEIVRAGAGSGKTTDLCETVSAAVIAGLDPSRILATTFTKKAAAELKGRIQAQLLSGANRDPAVAHRRADRLELAAIGTVHSVAHQLLSRYSIELGLSPRLEVITETAAKRALDELLGTMPVDSWRDLNVKAERLAATDLQNRVLALLAAKRGNRIDDERFRQDMANSADRVSELLAPQGVASTASPASLLTQLVEQALAGMETIPNDATKLTVDARQKLRRLRSQSNPAWNVYLQAARLTAGKRSGADALLDPLRNHAVQVRQNPQLHADIREFSELLAAETVRLGNHYESYKAERGLVDFTDLEVLFLELLEDAVLSASLAQDYDLILVDEFQDTNPLQLAIFQRLRRIAPRSRWVGDPKQAIYGFRDTDPELINDVWTKATDAARTDLPDNYRSQRGLVQLVGSLFSPIFGTTAVQTPKKAAIPRGVERWLLNTKNQSDDAIALACGISKLREEGIPLRHIAVLERANRLLGELAKALDIVGIPYLLGSPGLLSTREGVLTMAGLRLVADRNDSLAAATVIHILSDPKAHTPAWLAERLEALRAAEQAVEAGDPDAGRARIPWEGDARLGAIERIDRRTLSPMLVVQQLIEALGLPTLVQQWGDPARRCANLDSLLIHAREYEESALDAGEAVTITGLILYFENLIDNATDTRHPPLGHDAVTLMTYHAAKGLEWPVVILSGLHAERDPIMWSPIVTGGNSGEGDPLEGRTLQAWSWPFGYLDGPYGGLCTGSGLEDDALASPEGIERTSRAAQESLRLLYVGCTRAKNKLVFAHRDGKYDWLSRVSAFDQLLGSTQGEGEHAIAGIDTTLVIRSLSADMVDSCRYPLGTTERWITLPDAPITTSTNSRFHQPSHMPAAADPGTFIIKELAGPAHFPAGAKEAHYADIGNAVHAYFAAIPSMRGFDAAQKESVAERCLSSFSVSGLLTPSAIVSSGDRFCAWVESEFPGARWITEVPVTVSRSDGGHWNGAIDLLLELQDGRLVVIDHKSAPIRREHCAAKAATFSAQLHAYRDMMHRTANNVVSCWIHFPLAGVVARQE